ncbi:MAG: SpoIIE family protein phosphatase [Bacteroidetes bacterium]|nr:SpoIIE family protein phosphatase [Bacteroidota bacterium]
MSVILVFFAISCVEKKTNTSESVSFYKYKIINGIKIKAQAHVISLNDQPTRFKMGAPKIDIYKDDPSDFKIKGTYSVFNILDDFKKTKTYSIIQDKDSVYWFGTFDGLCRFDGVTYSWFTEKQGLPTHIIYDLLNDHSGNIWIGTAGCGVTVYDGDGIVTYTIKDGLVSNTVYCIFQDNAKNIWLGTSKGLSIFDGKRFSNFSRKEGFSDLEVRSIIQDKQGNIWIATFGDGVFKYDGKTFSQFTVTEGLSANEIYTLCLDNNGNIWIGSFNSGLTCYDGEKMVKLPCDENMHDIYDTHSIIQDMSGNIWLGTSYGMARLTGNLRSPYAEVSMFSGYPGTNKLTAVRFVPNSIYEDKNGFIWSGIDSRIEIFSPRVEKKDLIAPYAYVNNIKLFNKEIKWNQMKDTVLSNGERLHDISFDYIEKIDNLPINLSLPYDNNYVSFEYSAVNTHVDNVFTYDYKLDGLENNWITTTKTEISYPGLSPGNYTFEVKAFDKDRIYSNTYSYKFVIRSPWWKTWAFRIFLISILILGISIYIKWREKTLKLREKILLQTVKERTAEVEEQKNEIQEKHREITDSIQYAQRIQKSLLASQEILNKNLAEYFILFQPKDVVSGDFYWAKEFENNLFALVTADSTGHGVPGAIMSMLNISCLEKAIEVKHLVEPSEILNETRRKIIDTLAKDGSEHGGKDGMDCSLVLFDFENSRLTYAAANNPVWIVRQSNNEEGIKSELIELQPDKMPIGKHDKDYISFTQHVIPLERNDVVYTITDGFPDQFGGPKGKKFMYKQLKELLKTVSFCQLKNKR